MQALLKKIDFLTEIGWWIINLNPLFINNDNFKALIHSTSTRERLFPKLLTPYIDAVRQANREVKLLDVGCGPISRLAWGFETQKFQLTAVDPLAKFYNGLLALYRISYPVRPIPCSGEDLLRLFKPEQFDIVYSQNALDHASDVDACIKNISIVLKQGGVFHLEGFTKEGTKQRWQGLHKHDLSIHDGDLIWNNQRGDVKNLTRAYGLKCLYQNANQYAVGDWFIAQFKKTQNA